MASATNPYLSPITQPLTTDAGSGSETDYGSDFSEEELQELNREIDRIYGRTPSTTPATEAIEDNPILSNVEFVAPDESPSQERARIPRSAQRRGEAVRIEFEDDKTGICRGSEVVYPDRKYSISLFHRDIRHVSDTSSQRLVTGPLSQIQPSQLESDRKSVV